MCVCNRLSQSKNFCMKIIKYNIVAGVLFYPETGGVNCHLPQLTVADILVLPATIGDLERPNTELLDGDASQEARIAGIDLQLNPVSIPPPLMSRFRPGSLSLSRPPVPCGGFLWIVSNCLLENSARFAIPLPRRIFVAERRMQHGSYSVVWCFDSMMLMHWIS